MWKDIIDLVGGLNWERLIVIVLVFAIGVGATLMYEAQTHHFEIDRIDRTVEVLAKLESLREKIPKEDNAAETKVILNALYSQLDEISRPTAAVLALQTSYVKFTFAFAPWFLMALVYLSVDADDGRRSWVGFFGAIAFGAVFGGIGAVLPDFLWPWGNLLLFPFGIWILILVIFAKLGNQKRSGVT